MAADRFRVPDREDVVALLRVDLVAAYGHRIGVEPGRSLRGGFANLLLRVHMSGEDLPQGWPTHAVVRLAPEADRSPKAAREQAVQEFCLAHGFPAVRPLRNGILGGHPYVLLEFVDAPELTTHLVRPWRRARAIEILTQLHVRLHRIPLSDWPYPSMVRTADWWIDDVRVAIADRPDLGLDPALEWLVVNRRLATFADPRVCHFDFSPGNVLLRWGGTPTVVDWDMASLGDPSCDLAFTLEKLTLIPGAMPRPARPVARMLLGSSDEFLRSYAALAPVSEERLRYWRALYCVLVQLWSAGLSVGDVALIESSSDTLRRLSLFASARFRVLTGTR